MIDYYLSNQPEITNELLSICQENLQDIDFQDIYKLYNQFQKDIPKKYLQNITTTDNELIQVCYLETLKRFFQANHYTK